MSEEKTFGSWWPFTFAGAARFAARPLRMLLTLQVVVACAGGAAVILYFQHAWCPLVNEVIGRLPKKARWDHRSFEWTGEPSPIALAHNQLAALVVDLDLTGKAGQLSDVQVEFGATQWRIRSLFGYLDFPYAAGLFDLEPALLKPAWEAWKPAYLAFTGAISAFGIFCSWIGLATLGAPVARLMAFFSDRDLRLSQAWKICGAALMPGAIFFTAAIILYAFFRLNLIGLLLAALIHLFVDAIYMVIAPCRFPKKAPDATPLAPDANPFTPSDPEPGDR